jgi:hypothetical protein
MAESPQKPPANPSQPVASPKVSEILDDRQLTEIPEGVPGYTVAL